MNYNQILESNTKQDYQLTALDVFGKRVVIAYGSKAVLEEIKSFTKEEDKPSIDVNQIKGLTVQQAKDFLIANRP